MADQPDSVAKAAWLRRARPRALQFPAVLRGCGGRPASAAVYRAGKTLLSRAAVLLICGVCASAPAVEPPAWHSVDRLADVRAAWTREFSDLQARIRNLDAKDPAYARLQAEARHREALIHPADRDPADVVLRRTAALVRYITELEDAPALAEEQAEWESLRGRATAVSTQDAEARRQLYLDACRLRRRVAFTNPLVQMEALVFLTKHRPMRGDHHMVDQYYGFNARPGGGVRVLRDPFGEHPRVADPLRGRAVTNGRLAGQPLDGGAFNTLELDYDGQTMLFAWTACGSPPPGASWEGQPWLRHEAEAQGKPYYFWSPETAYHLFRADVEGSELLQLTEGPWHDFDPCFLPSGRIAFVSERRGGYLRCGGNRPNPTFTLYGMMPDGTDIIPLSYHETHEWKPSVDHHGMIAYTRWDYVDRDSDMAHHLWVCHPDGRDPRSYHANYSARRELRPWMELSIRAIPRSRKFVAVSAAHHGYEYGSLILIDQYAEDDGAMGQVQRLTPEVLLPESESAPGVPHAKGRHAPRGEVYGSPWPLSEDIHLCVYDAGQKHYAVYLLDSFGNRELIYRDPAVACLDPIPLRARPRPPVIPTATLHAEADRQGAAPEHATVSVVDVYDADVAWPEGTRIAALRVIQLFPKATYHMHEPMVGLADQSLARGVLGTVPVEADGSAYFDVPAGAVLYFQALDQRGLAVQSMRSATYAHPGEQLSCEGCHETKRRATPMRRRPPLATQRPPSAIAPEADGAYPVNFARLVQPVLDRHCVTCHRQRDDEGAPGLSGDIVGKNGWTQAYHSLVPHAWGLSGGNGVAFREGTRSSPGEIGARASGLFRHLEKGHHDVQLSPKEMRRVTLWLDCNSNFYGAYRETERQARGERVMPRLQ